MSTAEEKPKLKRKSPDHVVRRPSSATSRFHMSKDAVDVSVKHFLTLTNRQCVEMMAKIRWGSFKQVVCPHCNTGAEHYFSRKELRWKCKGCGKRFSVTSNTPFAGRRKPLQDLLAALHLWACAAAGKPSLQLRRELAFVGYNTSLTYTGKLREGLMRGYNIGYVSGIVEMDGAHASGRRAGEKRGVPLAYQFAEEEPNSDEPREATLTQSGQQRRKRKQIAQGTSLLHGGRFPRARRIVFTARRRSGAKGKGAERTLVGVGLAEGPEEVLALASKHVALPESILATDTGKAFTPLGKKFKLHVAVNHSEAMVGPNGEHVNNSESFTARMDRAEKGIFLNLEPKHLHDYAVEMAFREDHRRLAPGAIAERALNCVLGVGLSHDWRGYTHGKHRNYEHLVRGNQLARPSGPRKGSFPVAAMNGRVPK